MSYYTKQELDDLGFRKVGKNVKVSKQASIYNYERITLGDNSRIDDFCVVSGLVSIGAYVHLAPYCLVAGGELGVDLQDFSGLAYRVSIFSQSDDYSGMSLTNPNIPRIFKKEAFKSVNVGKHSIIGTGTVVMPGAHIAEGVAIGAMSLVRKPTEAWTIYSGNPLRRICSRKQDLLELEAQFLATLQKL